MNREFTFDLSPRLTRGYTKRDFDILRMGFEDGYKSSEDDTITKEKYYGDVYMYGYKSAFEFKTVYEIDPSNTLVSVTVKRGEHPSLSIVCEVHSADVRKRKTKVTYTFKLNDLKSLDYNEEEFMEMIEGFKRGFNGNIFGLYVSSTESEAYQHGYAYALAFRRIYRIYGGNLLRVEEAPRYHVPKYYGRALLIDILVPVSGSDDR